MTFHVLDHLAPLADGELDPTQRSQVETHLAACAACREARERYNVAARLLRESPTVAAPARVWVSIEAALHDRATQVSNQAVSWRMGPLYALAAAVLVFATAAGLWWGARAPQPWDVVRLDAAGRSERLVEGEWVETDAASTVRLGVGEIGTVDLAPGSHLQLLAAGAGEHRLNLRRGSLSAVILAPPRVFFVETPSSTVVDLGCAYTLDVGEDGTAVLRVTDGWAALEWNGRESLVPAGASARTHRDRGPGTPLFDDASELMREALHAFDDAGGAIDTILSEARGRDTLTLWHLMSRVQPIDRVRVLTRIVDLAPLPAGVDRDRVLELDRDAMRIWREELAWTW